MRVSARGAIGLWSVFTIATAAFLFACSQQTVRREEPIINPSPGHTEVKFGLPENELSNELKTIYFDYDLADLREQAKASLKFNAEWLRQHPQAIVQIEGHCDERGGEAYNVELGQDRAEAARNYLIQSGIDPERISTISYGALPGQNSRLWATNRKAAFVVIFPSR